MDNIDVSAFPRTRIADHHDYVLALGLARGRLAQSDAIHEQLEPLGVAHLFVGIVHFALNELPLLAICIFGFELSLRLYGLGKFRDDLLKGRSGKVGSNAIRGDSE